MRYDGGNVYQGSNSDVHLRHLKWAKWLTKTPVKEQRSALRIQDYPWYDLQKGEKTYVFRSDGTFNRTMLRLTVSGIPKQEDLRIFMDGQPLHWSSYGGEDRQFIEVTPTLFVWKRMTSF